MESSVKMLKKISVDCLYGKKKHYNAADRIHRYHNRLGVPLVILNVISTSVLLFAITQRTNTWGIYIPLCIALIASVLSALQTFFKFNVRGDGHRRIADRYLAIMKKADRLLAYLQDEVIDGKAFIERLEVMAQEVEEINRDAGAFPTRDQDYELAQRGVEAGEESYNENEMGI